MSLTLHALASAAKRFFGLWLVAGVLIFCYLAYDTSFFTKVPAGWSDWSWSELRK